MPAYDHSEASITFLLNAVKAHAYKHYEAGWDVVIECHSDAEIIEAIGNARIASRAIANVNRRLGISLHYERRREVESFIF